MKNFLPVALIAVALVGCGTWRNPIERISPHKIGVQQGNDITQDMLARLKPGMTPSQVRFLLGTPLVVEPFRNDRWDYVYRLEKGGRVVEQRRITVIFENGVLKGIEGDARPAEAKPEAAKEAAK